MSSKEKKYNVITGLFDKMVYGLIRLPHRNRLDPGDTPASAISSFLEELIMKDRGRAAALAAQGAVVYPDSPLGKERLNQFFGLLDTLVKKIIEQKEFLEFCYRLERMKEIELFDLLGKMESRYRLFCHLQEEIDAKHEQQAEELEKEEKKLSKKEAEHAALIYHLAIHKVSEILLDALVAECEENILGTGVPLRPEDRAFFRENMQRVLRAYAFYYSHSLRDRKQLAINAAPQYYQRYIEPLAEKDREFKTPFDLSQSATKNDELAAKVFSTVDAGDQLETIASVLCKLQPDPRNVPNLFDKFTKSSAAETCKINSDSFLEVRADLLKQTLHDPGDTAQIMTLQSMFEQEEQISKNKGNELHEFCEGYFPTGKKEAVFFNKKLLANCVIRQLKQEFNVDELCQLDFKKIDNLTNNCLSYLQAKEPSTEIIPIIISGITKEIELNSFYSSVFEIAKK